MTALLIPPWIYPEREEQEWLDEGTALFQSKFAPGLAQRQSFGGPRLKLSRTHTVRQDEMGMLLNTLMDTRGRFKTVYSRVHYDPRGSFPSTEVLSYSTFPSSTTGWSTGGAFELTVQDRVARLMANSTGISGTSMLFPTGGVNMVTSGAYAFRTHVLAGQGTLLARAEAGTSNVSGAYATSASSYSGLFTIGFTATQSASYVNVDPTGSTPSVGDYTRISWMSLTRCALVNGGSQTGSALTIDNLPNSTSGLLLPGDWISVGGELKMVTAPLNSIGGGTGYLQFSPALVRSPADNDPVIFGQPVGKFVASNVRVTNRFGQHAIVSYDLEHIYE